jgi:hypothetical protein
MIMVVKAVLAGLDPVIHATDAAGPDAGGSVDHRVKPGDDDCD